MIIKNGKTISSIYKGSQVIEKIYKGTLVVYESFKNLIVSGVPPLTLLNSKGVDLVDYKIFGNSVQNGEPTIDTPIEIESVGEYDETTGKYKIPIKVSGKNLFNLNDVTVGLLNSNGTVSDNKLYGISDYIPVTTPVTLSFIYATEPVRAGLYDKNKNFIKRLVCNTPYTITEEASYVRLSFTNLTNPTTGIQLEVGTEATNYEVYTETTTNIYLNEPLRKMGDYADYIDFENKKVVRKIVKKVFDGTEDLDIVDSTYDYTYYTISKQNVVINNACLCNMFQMQSNFAGAREGNNMFRVYYSDSGFSSRFAFRFYLNGAIVYKEDEVKALLTQYYNEGNPLTVYYTHANGLETEETIELPNIPTLKGTTILSVDTNIQPSNMEVVYKEGKTYYLSKEENDILNSILATNTETEKDISDAEIIRILDEIIGG